MRSWAEQTSPDFQFVLKLPKPITHERRLADAGEPLRGFLAAIEPLGPRAHTLWIQLPPSFSPADLDALAGWLREGRSPTVFIHTPDNVDALALARRFHDDVRARVPEVEPLPEPIPSGPPTLF